MIESSKLIPLNQDLDGVREKLSGLAQDERSLSARLEAVRASFEECRQQESCLSLLRGKIQGLQIQLTRLEGERAELQLKEHDLTRRIEAVRQEPQREEIGFFQDAVLTAIFPTSRHLSGDKLRDIVFDHELQQWFKFSDEEGVGRASRVKFYTDDHLQLDGCIVYADSADQRVREKKMMVMVQGNFGSWQGAFTHAQAMAKKYNCNVLIYNPRGVGVSGGKAERLSDAIVDCRAAIDFARSICGDPKKIALYGHSLGGGVSAEALRQMVEEGALPLGGVGLYINHHSFTSLSDVVKNVSPWTRLLGGLARTVIEGSGHLNLKTKRVIRQSRLADHVVIATAERDEIIRGTAQVGGRLQTSSKPIANDVTYVTTPYGHHEEVEYLDEQSLLSSSSDEEEGLPSSREEVERARKQLNLEHYHQAIRTWATH